MTKSVNEREIVLAVLMEVTEKGAYSHLILRDVLDKYQYLDKRERAFITRVTEGTLEHMIEIDYILDQFSKVKVKKMKPVIRNILRSGVYQLKYMDTVPDHAVCSEAVRLAARKGFSGLRGYVNGVLRNTARNLDQVKYPEEGLAALSVRYSCPEWILKLWQQDYEPDVIEAMLRDFQEEKPLVIRCCLNRISPEKLTERLRAEGVTVTVHPYLPYALEISGYDYLEGLESFREGLFVVQDVSSMLVAEIADPGPDARVIDVCAAPGGKALHMAEKLEGTGYVDARDLTPRKVEMIRENISRTGLENIGAKVQDAAVFDGESEEKADIVIADLPCSGLGVLGKKTDLKYKASPEGTEALVHLQREILSCVQRYVKPGGTLVYSTCTVDPAENMDNVYWFLQKYPEFRQDDIRGRLCPELREDVQGEGCLQLLPGIHKTDGFFIAGMVRRKSGEIQK
ncbi:MAG TPA: 16S rRNA (cytosine(967)-C(5))-methyltransferase RsmB [Candidatus Mediterraneibacter stercoravium]|uniref:16S rRNA (cytosine(967)-C(5))-methyltransferase n=1 Tax=Candidatus Mediterraneibacter stercoravium TaxID=2838685 RepID=A0A9D2GAP9_9FIRM|nr:16S rRNA (cytosine(967)-C(5))-methyltransferase RsmB [Candidatus Mediterraneibacter stercoravium]